EVPADPPNRTIRENPLRTVFAWIARFVVGVFLCCNLFPISFITSIAVFGWLQRRMQAVILRGWWRESPRRLEGTFQEFCDGLGVGAPVERPRWFWRERIVATLYQKKHGGFFRAVLRFVTLPVHSLFLDFKLGLTGLFATYMVTGWGCMIMLFSWYFGWLNSFHKGYEDAFLGILSGLFGSFLLMLAILYVPMAPAHQAAAGEIAAFFQFRVVTRLILARLTAYTLLLMSLAFVSLVFEIPRVVTINENLAANDPDISVEEALRLTEQYWLICTVFFFFSLLILRTLTAVIYRSAMLKAIRSGSVQIDDLPVRLNLWFQKLEILPQAQIPRPRFSALLRSTVSLKYRVFLFGVVFLFLFLFVLPPTTSGLLTLLDRVS